MICPWRYATFTLAEAEIGRDHGWDLCEQAHGPFHIGFKGLCSPGDLCRAELGNSRLNGVHGVCPARKFCDYVCM